MHKVRVACSVQVTDNLKLILEVGTIIISMNAIQHICLCNKDF
jgi:hypothetical protein